MNGPKLQDAKNAVQTQHRQHTTGTANAQNAARTADTQDTACAADAENAAGTADAENAARATQTQQAKVAAPAQNGATQRGRSATISRGRGGLLSFNHAAVTCSSLGVESVFS